MSLAAFYFFAPYLLKTKKSWVCNKAEPKTFQHTYFSTLELKIQFSIAMSLQANLISGGSVGGGGKKRELMSQK